MPPETFTDMGFPRAGIDLRRAYQDQRPAQLPDGQYARTCRAAVNVRGYEAMTQRNRGGQRQGLSKYVPAPVVSGWIVQGLGTVVTVGGSSVQASQSGRVVTLAAVSQGNVYAATAGATSWTQATNKTGNTPPLIYTGTVQSASINQRLYYADGSNWVYYDPSDNSVNRWAPTTQYPLPVDNQNNTPRLIAAWRGRIVLSGLLNFPNQWFMSAVDDPGNFDYTGVSLVDQVAGITVTSTSPARAIASENSPIGAVADVVTAIIPYSDDTLIWGGDHTIYQMSGDPGAGGQNDRISDSIGIAWGNAWTKGPDGTLYFFSNKTGIYAMKPGQGPPVRISQQVEQIVNAVDTGANVIQLVWNDRFQGVHVFITPGTQAGPTTNLFYEVRTGAWWTDTFANANHQPTAVCDFDGNTATDRTVLLGGWDGYVRSVDPTATTDDGTPIQSSVLLGPLCTNELDEILLKDMQVALASPGGPVNYAVYTGATAEIALASTPVTGTWQPGRNPTSYVRRAGHAHYIQISATNSWALEGIRVRIQGQGKLGQRRSF